MYIHIPFCHSKCAYCDFYSMPAKGRELERYIDAVIAELKMRRHEIPRPIRTIYIGGGTPSILPYNLLVKLVKAAVSAASEVEEFTIEVNPEDVTGDFVNLIKRLGINRVSMGVQSFDDTQLKAINRHHDAATAGNALRILKESGLNFNADLIFGLPGQTLESWKSSLAELISFRPNHISAYLLSYEPGTVLYAKLMKGQVEEASESLANEMYNLLISEIREAGYLHYEISNYSLPGYHSRHNSSYWDGTPYLGLGASAHSFDGTVRRINPSNVKQYVEEIERGREAYIIDEETDKNRFNDLVITALRTDKGLNIAEAAKRFDRGFIDEFSAQAKQLIASGKLITDGSIFMIPEQYWLTSDAILRDLIISS